jgi:hypothetical protein
MTEITLGIGYDSNGNFVIAGASDWAHTRTCQALIEEIRQEYIVRIDFVKVKLPIDTPADKVATR